MTPQQDAYDIAIIDENMIERENFIALYEQGRYSNEQIKFAIMAFSGGRGEVVLEKPREENDVQK